MKSSSIVLGLLIWLQGFAADTVQNPSFRSWSRSKAVRMLNSSAWARQETYTKVVEGVGSGVSGEKEIYNTFYVRFLSARPIREAYMRVQQLKDGYGRWTDEEKRRFDAQVEEKLKLDVERWIVVAVSFRSNDPNEESRARQEFMSETTGTLQNNVFLSTDKFAQVRLVAYFPPREESVGAKFVFPREIDGVPIVTKDDSAITFQYLGAPGVNPSGGRSSRNRSGSTTSAGLTASFSVKDMIVNGKLVV